MTTALEHVLELLRCPVCAGALATSGPSLRCANNHSFDVARQGYVHLATGRAGPGTGDTADMVAARVAFLGGGHFDRVSAAVAAAAGTAGPVLDVAGGTGHYLAVVLDAAPDAWGLCLDLSTPALRRAARAHPRAAAIGADAWQPLPVRDAAVATVLSVFGPRSVAELTRVLVPGGRIVVASPAPDHLQELIEPLGMLGVDSDKARRQAAAFADLHRAAHERVTYRCTMTHADVAAVVGMGPTASHRDAAAIATDAARLPEPVEVTVSVDIGVYVPGDDTRRDRTGILPG